MKKRQLFYRMIAFLLAFFMTISSESIIVMAETVSDNDVDVEETEDEKIEGSLKSNVELEIEKESRNTFSLYDKGMVLDGEGTIENPYLIYSVDDFDFVRDNNDAGIYYKLMNDIDLSEKIWIPLGTKNTDEEAFCANFDGNGYKLYNLEKMSSTYSQCGIFGYVKNSNIKNLGIIVKKDKQISSQYNGGIMMKIGNGCSIENCYVIGDYVTTSRDAGYAGLMASEYNGNISNCYVQGYVSVYGNSSLASAASGHSGGLIGTGNATISNCLCLAEVSCRSSSDSCFSGGICGGGKVKIQNCLFLGETYKGGGKVTGQIYGDKVHASVSVINSYYLVDNSANPSKENYGIGKSADELRNQTEYEGWDFNNIWIMDENNAGFPMLKSMINIERPISKYLLPVAADYSERSGQVILDNDFKFTIYFDKNITAIQNNGIYLRDTASGTTVRCLYYVLNGRELIIRTKEKMIDGKKYTLVINSNCIIDSDYSTNYYGGQSDIYFVSTCAPHFDGDGSIEDPYKISNVEQLNCVYYQPSKNYIMVNDIDAGTVDVIKSIGGCKDTSGTSGAWVSHYDTETQGEKGDFSGEFNGNGFTIKRIKKFSGQSVNGYAYDHYIALFSSLDGGIIKNLNIEMDEDCYLYNQREGTIVDYHGYPYIGILVANGKGKIENCSVWGNIYSNQETKYAGMIAGCFEGEIKNCSACGSISNEYNSSSSVVGGLVGYLTDRGSIRDCYSISSVVGAEKACAGGLVGKNAGTIKNSYSANTISKIINAGGLVGANTGSIKDSYYDSTISELSDDEKGIPKDSASMKIKDTYDNWDFDNCWEINEDANDGYPFLKESSSVEIKNGISDIEYLAMSELAYGNELLVDKTKTIKESGVIEKYIDSKSDINFTNDYLPFKQKEFLCRLLSYIEDWKIVSIYQCRENGFYAVVFEKDNKRVVAVRGSQALQLRVSSEGNKDWIDNLIYGFCQETSAQMSSALTFIEAIMKQDTGYEYSVTGHSLGSGLATLMANRAGIPARTFDGSPTTDVGYYKSNAVMGSTFHGIDKWLSIDLIDEKCPVGSLDKE